ncbi:MAG: hypothetical protein FJX76_05240 [Armatimonadetes bacterium]|nr:hypothetical protein [Armatimonadota bacterium]
MGIAAIGSWLRDNVTGRDTRDYIDNDGAKKHDDRIKDAEKKIDDWRKDLDRIDREAEIQPPRLSDFSTKDLVLVGGTAGAVLGTSAGALNGLTNTWLDTPKINVTETTHVIREPVYKGFTETLQPDVTRVPIYDGNGNVLRYEESTRGNWHRFTPQIEYKEVGEYKVPSAQVEHTNNGSNAVVDGFKGMLIGGAVGAGIGAAVAVTRHFTGQGAGGKQPREVDDQGKVIAVTTAGGAVIGAGVGLLSGLLERAHSTSERLEWKEPVMVSREIGQMPADHYHSIFGVTRESDVARVPVNADGPRMERGLFGMKPDMVGHSREINADPRFGIAGQVAGGAVLGAMGGVAAGVGINLMRKYI